MRLYGLARLTLDLFLLWTSRAAPSDIERIYGTLLKRLPDKEMKSVGRFTCKACRMYCGHSPNPDSTMI